jgi:hypothetical protein
LNPYRALSKILARTNASSETEYVFPGIWGVSPRNLVGSKVKGSGYIVSSCIIAQIFAIIVVRAGIEKPRYVSDLLVQWNRPIGDAGAHRSTSFSTQPTYGKAA